MKITVVGTGYVGLVTGTCLAETGNEVICVDIDEHKVTRMKSGDCLLYTSPSPRDRTRSRMPSSA